MLASPSAASTNVAAAARQMRERRHDQASHSTARKTTLAEPASCICGDGKRGGTNKSAAAAKNKLRAKVGCIGRKCLMTCFSALPSPRRGAVPLLEEPGGGGEGAALRGAPSPSPRPSPVKGEGEKTLRVFGMCS